MYVSGDTAHGFDPFLVASRPVPPHSCPVTQAPLSSVDTEGQSALPHPRLVQLVPAASHVSESPFPQTKRLSDGRARDRPRPPEETLWGTVEGPEEQGKPGPRGTQAGHGVMRRR